MNIFDLFFIALFLTAMATLLAAGWFAARGQFARAGRVLARLLVGAAVYMAVVIGASAVLPRRVLEVGQTQCFDDWCIAIEAFHRADAVNCRLDLRLSSRARRVSQRENGLAVYLTDDRGRRFDPVANNADVPLSVRLGPGDSVVTSRSFQVPADAPGLGAVVAHEGGFPIGWFIIGYDTWFRKPALTRLE